MGIDEKNNTIAEMFSIDDQRKLLKRFVPKTMDVDRIEEEATKTNWNNSPVSIVEIVFQQRFANILPRATLQQLKNNNLNVVPEGMVTVQDARACRREFVAIEEVIKDRIELLNSQQEDIKKAKKAGIHVLALYMNRCKENAWQNQYGGNKNKAPGDIQDQVISDSNTKKKRSSNITSNRKMKSHKKARIEHLTGRQQLKLAMDMSASKMGTTANENGSIPNFCDGITKQEAKPGNVVKKASVKTAIEAKDSSVKTHTLNLVNSDRDEASACDESLHYKIPKKAARSTAATNPVSTATKEGPPKNKFWEKLKIGSRIGIYW